MRAMQAMLLSICVTAWLLVIAGTGVKATPLDDYIAAPDPYFSWRLNSTWESFFGYKVYVLEVKSQQWLNATESSNPVWQHWVSICVPFTLDHSKVDTSFIWLGGGHINDPPPDNSEGAPGRMVTEVMAISSRTVTVHVTGLPNEPLTFFKDGHSRNEDDLIAYGWAYFLNHTNLPVWLPQLPMVKTAVKSMDAVQQFVAQQNWGFQINKFVVSGASKRGWATWLTAAVDNRVLAMIPLVMPILNMVPNMNHHYQAYGNWSFALDPYLDQGIMAYLNNPLFSAMTSIIDPYVYRSRFTMPKLVITSCGDEFFLPDSPQFFIDALPGETHLNLVPNAEHTLATGLPDVIETMTTFYQLVLENHPRPKYSYSLKKSNTTASTTVITSGDQKPSAVQMWHAATLSDSRRDFRLVICSKIPECIQPVIWYYQTLEETSQGSNTYVATLDAPPPGFGWRGFLVELLYEYPFLPFPDAERVLRVTTQVNIVPDYMPYPPCGNHCQ